MTLHLPSISSPKSTVRNLSRACLIEHAIRNGEGLLSHDGAFVTQTGKYTGRSPNDKFVVKDANSEAQVWWGKNNQPVDRKTADALHERIAAHLNGKNVYIQDCYAGADPHHRLKVRVITERAWHSLFAQNMFIAVAPQELDNFVPDFTLVHAPSFKADPGRDGTNSEVAVLVDFTRSLASICGTEYAGEIKKSIFSVMNYLMPPKNILSMHCSANKNEKGEVAVFFGLSGTGKTTLSADPSRFLIGDDEHGWSDDGVFNFEGGCYAKVIRLSQQDEPEIYATTKRLGTILENVVIDEKTRLLDLNSDAFTENTRASYDIAAISNADLSGKGGLPKHIIMLTCDAFGVLPPIARLTPEQAMYHFLSGYTARVAGTERGVTEPTAVFSSCFGAPFMVRHPNVYAKLLGEKMAKHHIPCWLVNTGWTGGPCGVGNRMRIKWTRALLHAALSGELDKVQFKPHPYFGVEFPIDVPGVPYEVLDPRKSWSDPMQYDAKAKQLAAMFQANFQAFAEHVDKAVLAAQPATEPQS